MHLCWNCLSFFYFCSMHRFIEYISDLLFLHDCVIIPDFGGFICNYRSAHIDDATGLICPPGKDILFNRNLTHNDGLLVNWVACKENISYDKAVKQVELFAEELKIKLNQKQRVTLGDIGTFYADRRFNIIFESGVNNFLSDTYGMEELRVEKIVSEDKKLKPQQISIPTAQEMSPYMNIDSGNWVHRLLRYGLAVAIIAGLVFITQQGIVYYGDNYSQQTVTNISTVQPALAPMPVNTPAVSTTTRIVISPDYDYVDCDLLESTGL